MRQNGLQVLNVLRKKVEAGKVANDLVQAGEDRELALEGVLAEEQLEDGMLIVSVVLPVSVHHRDLSQRGVIGHKRKEKEKERREEKRPSKPDTGP